MSLWLNFCVNTNNIKSRILFQNEACLILNKIKGEAAQGVGKEGIVNLPKKLAVELGKKEIIQAAHRIDVPVTGCVLFALTKESLVFLNSAFAGKGIIKIEKLYWAIVEKPSLPPPDFQPSGELIHWIETNSRHNKSFVYDEEAPGRKKAVLKYRVIGEGKNYLFVEAELLSGRHHQIRAQLAAIGMKIKGDVKYGARRAEKEGGIRLHARSLVFPNPLNPNEKIQVIADPPEIDNLWSEFLLIRGP